MSATNLNGRRATTLRAAPLSQAAFAPFGDVIDTTGSYDSINQGMGRRYPDLARLDIENDDGRVAISRVACMAEDVPVSLRLVERHPLGSQAFMPLNGQRYLVVVAPAGAAPKASALRAFIADGDQGINYHRGIWHHPMIALDTACEFLEVHRAGPGHNCDEAKLDTEVLVELDGSAAGRHA